MNVLAICAGIGGLELGVKDAAPFSRTVCYVEREAYAAATLVARMEDGSLDQAPIWDDLSTFDGKKWRGVVDCVAGGFPCQPFSQAGKQKRLEDERWLWNDILRIIDETGSNTCFFENVPGLTSHGLRRIALDMAERGFRVEWDMFTAQAVGAGHIRKRVFILAHRHDDRCQPCSLVQIRDAGGGGERRGISLNTLTELMWMTPRMTDAEKGGPNQRGSKGDQMLLSQAVWQTPAVFQGRKRRQASQDVREENLLPAQAEETALWSTPTARDFKDGGGDDFQGSDEQSTWPPSPEDETSWRVILTERPDLAPALPKVRGGSDGVPDELVQSATEYRVDRLRALGNAVVPQVASIALRFLAGAWLEDRGVDLVEDSEEWV